MNTIPSLILASQSPRRAQLLLEAGFDFEQRSPPFADPDQPPDHLRGHEAEAYAAALAQQKAASLAEQIDSAALILAADTICVDANGSLVGKPRDQTHAGEMIRSFIESEHRVLTGVALIRIVSDEREVESFADVATVTFGSIGNKQLDAYLATDDWRGKAGGYNLFDRQAAGWPIEVDGDPTTVVGLPMRRLVPVLRASLHSSG
ncbi:MAG: Maf family protein [Planctomycetota bacterium]